MTLEPAIPSISYIDLKGCDKDYYVMDEPALFLL